MKGVYKSGIADSQRVVMQKVMARSKGTLLDRPLIKSGDLAIGQYWTKLVTHTSKPGEVPMELVDFAKKLRVRRGSKQLGGWRGAWG